MTRGSHRRFVLALFDHLLNCCGASLFHCAQGMDTTSGTMCAPAPERTARSRSLLPVQCLRLDTTAYIQPPLTPPPPPAPFPSAWALYAVSQHPDVEARVVAELDKLLGPPGPKAAPLTYDSLGQMPYLSAVLRESMRRFPVAASGFFREPSSDVVTPSAKSPLPRWQPLSRLLTSVCVDHLRRGLMYSVLLPRRRVPAQEGLDGRDAVLLHEHSQRFQGCARSFCFPGAAFPLGAHLF